MEDFKQQFKEKKQTILNFLDNVYEYFQSADLEKSAEILADIREQVKNECFSIVVVGEFSSGKSTFINALMGEKFLPSFTNETTATVNFVRHSEKSNRGEGIVVFYNDPARIPDYAAATLENIEKYVSTRSDLNVTRDVNRVELYLNSRFLQDGVMLVDSPGLNGVAQGHKEITMTQIEKSNACIFAFSADAPGKGTDFQSLDFLQSRVDTILFLLNKIDVIKSSEKESVEDVIGLLKKRYHERFPDQKIPEIWPISAYKALVARSEKKLDYHGRSSHSREERQQLLAESRIESFEQRLWRFLTQGEKGRQMLLSPVDRSIKLLSDRKRSLDERINELKETKDTNELQENICKLKNEISEIEQRLSAQKSSIENELDILRREASEKIKSEALKISQDCLMDVSKWEDYSSLENELACLNKKITHSYNRAVENAIEEMVEEFEQKMVNRYQDFKREAFETILDKRPAEVDKPIIELETKSFSFGIEDYDKKIASFEEEVNKLNSQIDKIAGDKVKELALRQQKEKLDAKITEVEEDKRTFIRICGDKPPIKYIDKQITQKQDREGILGKVAQFLVGRKDVIVHFTERDKTELNEYLQEREQHYKNCDQDIAKYKNEMAKLPSEGLSPEELDRKMRLLEKKINEYFEEKARLRDNHSAELERKQKRAKEIVGKEVENSLRKNEDLILKKFRKDIRAIKDDLVMISLTAIEANANKALESKTQELELRKRQLESSQQERNEWIQKYTVELTRIQPIIEKGISLQVDLENRAVDRIVRD